MVERKSYKVVQGYYITGSRGKFVEQHNAGEILRLTDSESKLLTIEGFIEPYEEDIQVDKGMERKELLSEANTYSIYDIFNLTNNHDLDGWKIVCDCEGVDYEIENNKGVLTICNGNLKTVELRELLNDEKLISLTFKLVKVKEVVWTPCTFGEAMVKKTEDINCKLKFVNKPFEYKSLDLCKTLQKMLDIIDLNGINNKDRWEYLEK